LSEANALTAPNKPTIFLSIFISMVLTKRATCRKVINRI
jgi:hypothetical protein